MLIDSLWLGFLMQKPLKLRGFKPFIGGFKPFLEGFEPFIGGFEPFIGGFENKTSCFVICEVRAPARSSLDREQTSQIHINFSHIFPTNLPPENIVVAKKCQPCCRYKVSTMFQVVHLGLQTLFVPYFKLRNSLTVATVTIAIATQRPNTLCIVVKIKDSYSGLFDSKTKLVVS